MTTTSLTPEQPRRRGHGRGFASLTPEERSHISREGGRAAHRSGHARKWTKEEAKVAGRKGGATDRGGRANKGRRNKRYGFEEEV